MYSLQLF